MVLEVNRYKMPLYKAYKLELKMVIRVTLSVIRTTWGAESPVTVTHNTSSDHYQDSSSNKGMTSTEEETILNLNNFSAYDISECNNKWGFAKTSQS